MTYLTQRQAKELVLERWATAWATLHPTDVTYCFDNEFFKEPDPSDAAVKGWARVSLRLLPSDQDTIGGVGNRQYARPALINVQLFTPVQSGTYVADGLADEVRTLFEGVSFGGITPAGGARVLEPPASEDDGHWREVVVSVPVTYYELK